MSAAGPDEASPNAGAGGERGGPKGRRWVKWVIAGVVVVLLAVVVAPYVYIHYIEGDPPKPLALDSAPATSAGTAPSTAATSAAGTTGGAATGPTTAASSDLDGTWKIGGDSQAGYRVDETLFGQSTTAVGRTSDVTGEMTVKGATIPTSTVKVDLTTVKSDRSQRDGQFQGRIMNTGKFPTATFTLTEPIDLGQMPEVGKQISTKATGKLEVHGTTKTVTVDLAAQRKGDGIQVSGKIPVTFSDYGIPNPTFGPAQVGDTGTIEFLLDYSR